MPPAPIAPMLVSLPLTAAASAAAHPSQPQPFSLRKRWWGRLAIPIAATRATAPA